ncbi:hypothetical protein GXP67_24630 [Rhodocytophaga rosea]|uniref:DUF4157 domain-containing protein n=1 Tax=Rhodocytophaga rosea TaxID=2704465 RepID=A0A6C0GNJ3_9BACT|nr:hypothetical protein [Rhodocytophaga rosea]QHT69605.1 hypothetical protein GXP67_24630 [Rhodocytophaga rosea]
MIRHLSFIPARGMALFPFILVKYHKDLTDERLIRHEKIHIRQQVELLVIPFYFFYLINYLWNRLRGQSHLNAYLNICFEREAYTHDDDAYYLKYRKWGAFLRYL